MSELEGEKKLMYDLIFGEKEEYEIPIMEYISLNEIDDFTEKIMKNLELSGITIKDELLVLTKDKKIWKLKISRNLK